jgi:hypothetical protein
LLIPTVQYRDIYTHTIKRTGWGVTIQVLTDATDKRFTLLFLKETAIVSEIWSTGWIKMIWLFRCQEHNSHSHIYIPQRRTNRASFQHSRTYKNKTEWYRELWLKHTTANPCVQYR